ncbi:MAG: 3-hydroxybutyryl-CoA dehydrogenase [Clostridiales bacterium]|jgi:3-hydroxybutyryl-CoA dehydrogenase|nr:3-hydroxybutyryl-CoA dehydrogenase [Clostridiales bacterium]
MEIQSVLLIGAGLMGRGIAESLLRSGLRIFWYDVRQEDLKKALMGIEKSFQKQIAKGRLSEEEARTCLANATLLDSLESKAEVQLVIEAVSEKLSIKESLFQTLNQICDEKTIFVSNTSSLSINTLGRMSKRPEQFMGMHFFNPVPVMPLVELIRGLKTSEETVETIKGLVAKLGKTPISAPDFPGFTVNRILVPMLNEAYFCVMEGALPEDVDQGMKLGCNFPMGPLELSDFIGLDTILSVLEIMHQGFGDSKYRPCPLLKNMVEAGMYGRKSGQGFYDYRS